MKLKDGFYASSHGIGGLLLDMPTKNPKTRKKPKFSCVVRFHSSDFGFAVQDPESKTASNRGIEEVGRRRKY